MDLKTDMQTASATARTPLSTRYRIEIANKMAIEPVFAVLDGAHFDDLQNDLLERSVPARSLFLPGGDPQWRREGPWLVALINQQICDHIIDLAFEKPCAVFWSCPAGETALYRHLRTINRVLVPDDRIENNDGETGEKVVYERVLFRHWDPNVLASVLQSFTKAQFARFLGPASMVLMNAPLYGGLKRLTYSSTFPPAPNGPLKITPTEIAATNEFMAEAATIRICNYLRNVAPSQTAGMNDAELSAATDGYIREGRRYGVQSEAALARWSYLQLVTSGKLMTNPDVCKVVMAKDPTVSVDQRVQLLLQASLKYATENR
ncbi:DUF4123 domain-containing protein [Rhizobium sp. 9T]|uniref:DUF4123 domain-containing protein n=1 Tax=Rhizobium TaxID=379 RepID=UPI001C933379|nr:MULTISPECIES: DUF4123 domain-containing protein [Rhizobium]MBY4607772.1 DUF4123 domain-containing protein [Rhizobium croatiense]ULR42945.1 DUF4123 domain-containing protein [Rhizobium sp. K102]